MDSEHITIKQVILRVLSVIVAAVGAVACVRSLFLQVNNTGDITASVSWFAGLLTLVAACAGYACTTMPRSKKNKVLLAAIIGVILCACLCYYELNYLYIKQTIFVSIVALFVQALALVIYHFILRAQDKDAI